ncbi:hypothetical protein [Caryophanon tenue]|uniref:Uncharacterized protein n=1 Tax=Caryophanon tenue TaxID=33978 RepID=A0A1C0Y7H3_9BACL|nr:hypothetical protein [Caryophanon tenue]OCS83085.1 hypothetical protein A6M13_06700 [Caryophanon tenue]
MTTVALFQDNVRTINEYTGWRMHGNVVDLAMRLSVKNRRFDPLVYEGVREHIKRHTHLLSKARYDKVIRHALFSRAHCEQHVETFIADVFQNVRKLRDMNLAHRAPLYHAAIYFERHHRIDQTRLLEVLAILQRVTPKNVEPSSYHAVVLAKLPHATSQIDTQLTQILALIQQKGFDQQYAHITATMTYIREVDMEECATTALALQAHLAKEVLLRPVYDSYLWLISTKYDAWSAWKRLQEFKQALEQLTPTLPPKTDITLLALQLLSADVLDCSDTRYDDDCFQDMFYDFTTACDDSGRVDTACDDASGGSDSADGGDSGGGGGGD